MNTNTQAETDQTQDNETQDDRANHDYYDDGLVHSHGWAASSNER